ncbi:MAG: hypothetical protein NVSMB65_17450 [Chloroflexota bacterium]
MVPAVHNFGDALLTSLTSALALFLGAIPKVIGFLIILLIGFVIAGILAKAVSSVLRAAKFNDMAKRSGFAGFVQNMGVKTDASGVIALTVKWFVRLIVLVVAFDELGLPAVSQVLQQLLLWLPNLIVALVILVIAGLVANALHSLVRGAAAEAGLGKPDMLATVARVAVWGFAIIIAVNQIGIASTLVNTLFMGFVGALALALGLAFGLGGRDTAGQIVQNWYDKSQQAAPKLERAAAAAGQQANGAIRQGSQTLRETSQN